MSRLRLRRSSVRIAAVAWFSAAFLLPVFDAGADTSYNFINYPALQNGYTIYGEIVTDGRMGTLGAGDFRSAAGDPLYPGTAISLSNSGYLTPLPAYFVQFNNLMAVDLPGTGNVLEATDGSVGISNDNEMFAISYDAAGNTSTYEGSVPGPYLWDTHATLTAPLVIAVETAVPEPATLALLISALLGLAALQRVKTHYRQSSGCPAA
jgi:hypothetical protein